MGISSTILELLFPSKCLSCQKNGSYLCINCLANSPSAERESAEWIIPLFDYRHPPIKKAIKLLKYQNKKKIADIFGEVLYGRMLEELSELRVMNNFIEPILIPIPLSKKRYRARGYNQAELICKKLIELDSKEKNFSLEKNVLLKIKETEHQARIENRATRLKNLVGSFAVQNGHKIKEKNIILIDDVTTTGATLEEAKKTLKNAGVKKIIAFTIAH